MKAGITNSNGLIFIEAAWYNTVGFVLCQDTLTREMKCYTYKLNGDDHYGEPYSELQDVEKIMAHGSTFPLEAARFLFDWDIDKDWVEEHPELFL